MEIPKTVRLNSGTDMPTVGLGVWQAEDGAEVMDAIHAALGSGYRLIDTAKIYNNETGVGEAIRTGGVERGDIFLTTKLWNSDHGHDRSLAAFDGSLQRLGTDYVDLYLIHWPGGGERVESWQALEELHADHRARAIGVSNFSIDHIEELISRGLTVPAVNQVEFHPFIYEEQKELLDYCREKGIVFEAYSPLARGRKVDHPLFAEIGAAVQRTPAQVMLRWALQHGAVVIPKSVNPERIRQNIDIYSFELSEEQMDRINNLSDGKRTIGLMRHIFNR